MAAIDKCYTCSPQEYKDFKEWAKGRSYTTPRGVKINVSDYIMAWDDKNFFDESGEPKWRPIFNSPTHFDNYLYHHCPLKFIQDWLADRYSGDGYCKGLSDDITCTPQIPDYAPCTKVTVVKKGFCNVERSRFVSVKDAEGRCLLCNEDQDFWMLADEDDEWSSSDMWFDEISVRAIIRRTIKKWRLPKGYTILIQGPYEGDDWILKTR